jgi:hypothetical protein
LTSVLKAALKRALAKGLVVQEGRLYKALECKSPAPSPRKRRVSSPDREPPKVDPPALVEWALASRVDDNVILHSNLCFSSFELYSNFKCRERSMLLIYLTLLWRLVVYRLLNACFLYFVTYEPEVKYISSIIF